MERKNSINLLPHNKKAYEAVMKHFNEGNRKAAVIQSTGTGKSYVGGMVSTHFNKVLVVAPNEYVLNQAVSVTPNADTATYSLLAIHEEMPTGYDLIWFDEFHRIGAPIWKKGVDKVIEANPEAKILGTTATPDRSLENRNIADEFFDGDVVSNITLTDAWINHILRVPKYVIGVVSMNSTQADYTERINSSTRIDEVRKKEATALLNNTIRDWSCSHGVPRILNKYIDKDVERMIVFAQTISKLDEVVSSIQPWFDEAGIKLANVYAIHSEMGVEAKRQMQAFENDDTEGVKVLVSVNMLNEGIHVSRVDAVMLLRSTISKNLYLQQIGRCFAVGQKHQPIILDLADNLTTACGYDGIYDAQRKYLEGVSNEKKERTPDEFMIIDTLKETREVIKLIDSQVPKFISLTFEEAKEIASHYKFLRDFRIKEPAVYDQVHRKGWLQEITKDMIRLRKKEDDYTVEECISLTNGCSNRTEFMRKYPSYYNWMCLNSLIEVVFANLPSKRCSKKEYSFEECQEYASQCKNRTEFQTRFSGRYRFALEKGWIDDIFGKKSKMHINNKEYCIQWCSQFKSKADAIKENCAIVKYAYKHGWLDECFAHLKPKVC